MTTELFVRPRTMSRIREGPLGPHIDDFAVLLWSRSHTPATMREKIRIVAHMSRWMRRKSLQVEDVKEQTIETFLQSRKKYRRIELGDLPSLRLFLDRLRERNIVSHPPKTVVVSIHPLERAYSEYLLRERALSHDVIAQHTLVVRRFLSAFHKPNKARLWKIQSREITNFMLSYVRRFGSAAARRAVYALRSFFRFLRLQGELDQDLSHAVPSVPYWRLAALPSFLERQQVQQLLQHCDRQTPLGRRDLAILLLISRLGLRAREVTLLTLEDIHWDAGEITIRGKGGRENRLPLPHDIGNALAAYLRWGRPHSTTRRVFVRALAPHTGFKGSESVSQIVRTAVARAGLRIPRSGAHLLRRTLATEMLRRGASLFEIGAILNHRNPNTTAIYAKVDLPQLRSLAQPWRGGSL